MREESEQTNTQQDPFVRTSELARELDVCVETVLRMVKRRQLPEPAIKLSGRAGMRWRRSQIDQFLAEQAARPEGLPHGAA